MIKVVVTVEVVGVVVVTVGIVDVVVDTVKVVVIVKVVVVATVDVVAVTVKVVVVKFNEKGVDVVNEDDVLVEVVSVPLVMEDALTELSLTQAQILSLKPVVL